MRDGPAALAIGAVAVVCCAALPVLAGVAGALTLGIVLGIGAGLAALIALVSAIALAARARRRRAYGSLDTSAPPPGRPTAPSDGSRDSRSADSATLTDDNE